MSSIINRFFSLFNSKKEIKQNVHINKSLSNEEIMNETNKLYEYALLQLSNINREIEELENKLNRYKNNPLQKRDLILKINELEKLYEEKELECFDRKQDYLYACKLYYMDK